MTQDDSAATSPPHEDDAIERRIQEQPGVQPGVWVKRAVLLLVVIVVAWVVYLMAAAFFPRWWAQRIADQVGGSMTAGVLWGMFYGFLFSFVPALVLFQIRRRFFSWTWRFVVAAVALALAIPNWLTLSVVAGNSNAAHAGERIMDVDAPGFRAATLVTVIVGVALAMLVTGMSIQMKRRKTQVKRLRGERDELRRGNREAEQDSDTDRP